ncbi:MAG: hypothetical protein ACXW3Z_08505 [Limisphaerales bacterium]
MKRSSESGPTLRWLKYLALIAFTASVSTNVGHTAEEIGSKPDNNLTRTNSGAQIECTTPNGQVLQLAPVGEQNKKAGALIMENDTVSGPLPQGQTTFVIKLPTTAPLERFTFVNEKAAAAGQLKISVSNHQLAANSPDWVEVDGSIAFKKKRLFNLLMVGVEARYVKLTFNVETPGRIASLALYGGETVERLALR